MCLVKAEIRNYFSPPLTSTIIGLSGSAVNVTSNLLGVRDLACFSCDAFKLLTGLLLSASLCGYDLLYLEFYEGKMCGLSATSLPIFAILSYEVAASIFINSGRLSRICSTVRSKGVTPASILV